MKNKIKLDNVPSEFKSRLEDSKFYKFDFGLKEYKEGSIFNDTFISTILGFSAIDIDFRSNFHSIGNIKEAINEADKIAKEFLIPNFQKPLLFFSYKLSFAKNLFEIKEDLKLIKNHNFDVFELHIDHNDSSHIKSILEFITSNLIDRAFSINISRTKLSNANMIEIIKLANEKIKKNIMIEVEGEIATNEKYNESNETIQTISTADIINKQLKLKELKYRRIPILLSGGTNSKTAELARKCGVLFNGITYTKNFLKGLKYQNIDLIKEEIKLRNFAKISKINQL